MYANDFWCHWAFGTVFVARLCCVSAPVSRLDRTMRPTPLERETPPWNLLLFFYNIDVTTEFTMCHSDRFLSRFVNAVHVNHERRNFNWPRNLWELFSVFGARFLVFRMNFMPHWGLTTAHSMNTPSRHFVSFDTLSGLINFESILSAARVPSPLSLTGHIYSNIYIYVSIYIPFEEPGLAANLIWL